MDKIIIIILIHIIGAITHVAIHHKTGVLKQAAKNDGIRYAKPSDIIVMDCVAWEFTLLMSLLMYAGEEIDNYYK